MSNKRFIKGMEVSQSAEHLMGKIEAQTHGKRAWKAGETQEIATAYTIERGLYPHWLAGSHLETETDTARHAAWLEGITTTLASQYRFAPKTTTEGIAHQVNPKADARAAALKSPKTPYEIALATLAKEYRAKAADLAKAAKAAKAAKRKAAKEQPTEGEQPTE